jgi:hypothetical protein
MDMRRPLIVGLGVTVLLVANAAFAASLIEVRDDKGVDEHSATASPGWVGWTQNSLEHPRRYNAFANPTGGSAVRLNPPDSRVINVDLDGNTAVFDYFGRGFLDLSLYDLQAKTRSEPPNGVNTRLAEYEPSLSGYNLFFTRDNFSAVPNRDAWIRVILFDVQTGETDILEQLPWRRHFLISNQVNGGYLTWESCRIGSVGFFDCQVFWHRISTGRTVEIPNPGLQQYGSAVSNDGTLYFARTGHHNAWRCGSHTRLLRFERGSAGPVRIAEIPQGLDVLHMDALDEADGSTTLYLDRLNCDRGNGGVFKIPNADTA